MSIGIHDSWGLGQADRDHSTLQQKKMVRDMPKVEGERRNPSVSTRSSFYRVAQKTYSFRPPATTKNDMRHKGHGETITTARGQHPRSHFKKHWNMMDEETGQIRSFTEKVNYDTQCIDVDAKWVDGPIVDIDATTSRMAARMKRTGQFPAEGTEMHPMLKSKIGGQKEASRVRRPVRYQGSKPKSPNVAARLKRKDRANRRGSEPKNIFQITQ